MSELRDPFPMQSEEARRLAASVDGGTSQTSSNNEGGLGWNKMASTTATDTDSNKNANSNDMSMEMEGEESLVLKRKHKKPSNSSSSSDNIYDQVEEEELNSSQKRKRKNRTMDDYIDRDVAGIEPNHKRSEIIRTLTLSSTLFFMIGGYWLLRSLKDTVITALCGVEVIPKAKVLSVPVVLVVVGIYNRFLDNPNLYKHTLFYIFGTFYFCLFSLISYLLTHPTIGLPNQAVDPNRILGWISYCSIESFGSVMVSLFWSFTNSNFDLESAKDNYALLVATAQVGSVLGPSVVKVFAESWGVARCYLMGAVCILCLQLTMWIYVNVYGTEETRRDGVNGGNIGNIGNGNINNATTNEEKPKKKKGAGVLEGIHLFVKHNYVKGIFAISCLFMVEVTIVDYTMKRLAKDHFAELHPCLPGNSCWESEPKGLSEDAIVAMASFMGFFGQATNVLSLLLSFFGTSAIIRYLGLRLTLLLFPTLCLIVIIIVRLSPTLYTVFAAMMILKANSYALNNPTKEMLYQPTSSAVRYKAKSWIDVFGARGSKALGSLVVMPFADSAELLISNGSLVGMAVASFLIWNARFMGRSFDRYIESGHVVGESRFEDECRIGSTIVVDEDDDDVMEEDGDDESAKIQKIAMIEQNERESTSCAIYEDDDLEEDVSDNGHSSDGSKEVELV